MTHTDPRLTITLTTRDAEGLRGECLLREFNASLMAFQETVKRQTREIRDAAQEKHNAYLHGEVDSLRSQLATLQRLGDATKEMGTKYLGESRHLYLRSTGRLVRDKFEAALAAWPATPAAKENPAIPTVSSSDPCPECGSSKWTPNGDCSACVERDSSPDYAILYSLGADPTPTQTEAEAEVERLRRTVDERDSTIAELHVSLDAARLDAKRLERVLADRRAKIDALVGAVDGLALFDDSMFSGRTCVSNISLAALHRAADAARQPTEAAT